MENVRARMTVCFEDPFWIGVYERCENGATRACKIMFGAQPKDGEVYAFLLQSWRGLRFGPPVEEIAEPRAVNPKRMSRLVHRELRGSGVGTKAQQALGLLREQGKKERAQAGREHKREERELQFAIRRQKKKEKHAGHKPAQQKGRARIFIRARPFCRAMRRVRRRFSARDSGACA